MTGLLLGGSLAPAGMSANFIRRGLDEVLDTLVQWRRGVGHDPSTSGVALADLPTALEPFQAAWSREALFDCGDWTAYVNNGIQGGDPTASASYLGAALGVDVLTAMNSPLHPPGHASTQLWVEPGSDSKLGKRSIAAYAADGRWSWIVNGAPLPFEDESRYTARRVRDRFDRPLLVEYLRRNEIVVDDATFYGRGVLVQQGRQHRRRELSAEELRADLGL